MESDFMNEIKPLKDVTHRQKEEFDSLTKENTKKNAKHKPFYLFYAFSIIISILAIMPLSSTIFMFVSGVLLVVFVIITFLFSLGMVLNSKGYRTFVKKSFKFLGDFYELPDKYPIVIDVLVGLAIASIVCNILSIIFAIHCRKIEKKGFIGNIVANIIFSIISACLIVVYASMK